MRARILHAGFLGQCILLQACKVAGAAEFAFSPAIEELEKACCDAMATGMDNLVFTEDDSERMAPIAW